jgi:hypothetical protein
MLSISKALCALHSEATTLKENRHPERLNGNEKPVALGY